MTSHPYASAQSRAAKRSVAKKLARTAHVTEAGGSQVTKPAAASLGKPLACISQAKHRRIVEMLHDLRIGAEALSANADGLLSRLS